MSYILRQSGVPLVRWVLRAAFLGVVGLLLTSGSDRAESCTQNPAAGPVGSNCPVPVSAANARRWELKSNSIAVTSTNPLGGALTVSGIYKGIGSHVMEQLADIELTDTGTNKISFAKINALTVKNAFGGVGSGEGNRNAIFGWLRQAGATPYSDPAYHFHTAIFGWTDIHASDAKNAADYYAFGGLTEINNPVVAGGVKGAEFDTSIKAGASTPYHATLTVDLVNNHAVRGSNFDAAIAIGRDASTLATYKNGVVFGDPNGPWPFASDSTLIGTSGIAIVDNGIDLSALRCATACLKLPGLTADGNGNLSVAGLRAGGVPVPSFGTPASASAPCEQGTIQFDAAYIYTCVSTNSWHRVSNGAGW